MIASETITNGIAPVQRIALTPSEAAAALGISTRTFRTLISSGQMIDPVRFGDRLPRYSVRALSEWIDAGCPPPATWNRREGAMA